MENYWYKVEEMHILTKSSQPYDYHPIALELEQQHIFDCTVVFSHHISKGRITQHGQKYVDRPLHILLCSFVGQFFNG